MSVETTPARELTAEEAQKRAEDMYALDQQIKAAFAKGREALWEVAACLSRFEEESGWTALSYEKRNDWLADPEVQMTYRTYKRLVETYREIVERRQVPFEEVKQLDVAKCDIVLSKVRTGEVEIRKALDDAAQMGARDLREEYYSKPESPPAPAGSEDKPANVGNGGAPPAQPADGPPVRASDGEEVPVLGADGEPLETDDPDDALAAELEDEPDPTGQVSPLDEEMAARAHAQAAADAAEDEEPAQNPQPVDSGQVVAGRAVIDVDELVPEAQVVLEWLDQGLNATSDVMRVNALNKARDFIAKLFPNL